MYKKAMKKNINAHCNYTHVKEKVKKASGT